MTIYRIYSAPKCASGRYGRAKDQPLVIKSFKSVKARQRHWEDKILPYSKIEPGDEFEYVLCDSGAGKWNFVSEKRYASRQLLQGKRELL